MLIVAGMAVDLMRYETQRTALQGTIDNAVLAAANLNQTNDSEALVKSYFEKNGYDPNQVRVSFSEDRIGTNGTLIGRTVAADYDLNMNTLFMNLIGIEDLKGHSNGTAQESIQGVEISLVVDISGSMAGSKLRDLKTAAKNFLGIVMDDGTSGGGAVTTVSLVPYNSAVVVPDQILARLNTQERVISTAADKYHVEKTSFGGAVTEYDREAPNSRCIQFSDAQMMTTNLTANYAAIRQVTPNTRLERVGYFDEGSKSSGAGDTHARPADGSNRFCDPTRGSIVLHETRKPVLEAAIDRLEADGWTSVDQGMKWGVALLDPGMRPVVNGMADAGLLPSGARDRPGTYSERETMKIVVLMTDGANTVTQDIKAEFKRGPSPVWFSESAAGGLPFTTSANSTTGYFNGFYVQAGGAMGSGYSGFSNSKYWFRPQNPASNTDGVYVSRDALPADAKQLTWTQLYDRFSEYAVADLFRENKSSKDARLDAMYSKLRSAIYEPNSYSALDRRLNGTTNNSIYGICDVAKVNNDMMVFTIAFDVDANSDPEKQMKACASNTGSYFDADSGNELDEAFRAIARQITKLRLTQ